MQEYIDGHVNETVECWNFRCHRRLLGESLDDFLIALRKLIKTYKFCSEQCTQNNLHDQIIKGLRDIETIEDLLKENNFTLDNAIAKCRSLKAAQKHCSDMIRQEPKAMAALHITQWGRTKATIGQGICSGCGEHGIKGDINNAQHMTAHVQCCQKGVTFPRCVAVRQHNRSQHRHQSMLSMWIHNKTSRSKYVCMQWVK